MSSSVSPEYICFFFAVGDTKILRVFEQGLSASLFYELGKHLYSRQPSAQEIGGKAHMGVHT